MNEQRSMLQVYFEDPFWVGLFQRWESGKLRVCKVTFGAEPKEQELYCFLQARYASLAFGPAVPDSEKPMHKNPKRRQRTAHRLLLQNGAGTKSQQALKLQQQERKTLRKAEQHDRQKRHDVFRFQKKQQKKKEKHRGR